MATVWKVTYETTQPPVTGEYADKGFFLPMLSHAMVVTEKDSIEELGSTIGKLDQFKWSRIISVENNGPIHTVKNERDTP
jgi:hypothetical protein